MSKGLFPGVLIICVVGAIPFILLTALIMHFSPAAPVRAESSLTKATAPANPLDERWDRLKKWNLDLNRRRTALNPHDIASVAAFNVEAEAYRKELTEVQQLRAQSRTAAAESGSIAQVSNPPPNSAVPGLPPIAEPPDSRGHRDPLSPAPADGAYVGRYR